MAVLAVCLAGLTAVTMQVRCIDAAREAARLAARGDAAATRVAQRIAPDSARVEIRRDGDFIVSRVAASSALLPSISIVGDAVAAVEPGG